MFQNDFFCIIVEVVKGKQGHQVARGQGITEVLEDAHRVHILRLWSLDSVSHFCFLPCQLGAGTFSNWRDDKSPQPHYEGCQNPTKLMFCITFLRETDLYPDESAALGSLCNILIALFQDYI